MHRHTVSPVPQPPSSQSNCRSTHHSSIFLHEDLRGSLDTQLDVVNKDPTRQLSPSLCGYIDVMHAQTVAAEASGMVSLTFRRCQFLSIWSEFVRRAGRSPQVIARAVLLVEQSDDSEEDNGDKKRGEQERREEEDADTGDSRREIEWEHMLILTCESATRQGVMLYQ
ncbi:hypothetical protein BJ165DRAFT_1531788 [Panaeolus papilionaceus]|nr:hypothetical protein BJ165DRAFT_1531788 [Panaeolus papilionaceus]